MFLKRKRFSSISLKHIFSATFLLYFLSAQEFIPADPYYLILSEKAQFQNELPLAPNTFRPLFFNSDSISLSATFRSENYFNDNAPNQENMDVRYFSRGLSLFNSIQILFNSPYITFMAEPYILSNKLKNIESVNRKGIFSVLNDRPLDSFQRPPSQGFRNIFAFFHFKGLGFGWHKGNRWWGPGIHSSLQMTNNTQPIPAQVVGTIREIRFGSLGFYGLYTFAHMNQKPDYLRKYYTSLNGQISWYGPVILSIGFSRNYLSGGVLSNGYKWGEEDARKIVFEGVFTSNLIGNEYTIGGHDLWDQTLSSYFTIVFPKRDLKIYADVGFNDNRMYFADFLSQPDHSMATIIGIRDYGISNNNKWVWGLEWTNLMITYSSRHRPTGPGTWYNRSLYDYSSYYGRRWAAHSGADSDDWYLYIGYLSKKLMIIPAVNYERHGIVSHRPAEVKLEFRMDMRYKYKDIWFGVYYEKQFEAFLGFPDHYYVDIYGSKIDASEGKLANSRRTNTLILSLSKDIKILPN